MKTITINIPDDCDIQIVRKEEKKESVIRNYQDLINNHIKVSGYYIGTAGGIIDAYNMPANNNNRNIAASEKVAKSMLAMAMISQLMPYYGGMITQEEWDDSYITKYIIGRTNNDIYINYYNNSFCFLAFHTEEQRDEFLKYNKQLVKDYLMID